MWFIVHDVFSRKEISMYETRAKAKNELEALCQYLVEHEKFRSLEKKEVSHILKFSNISILAYERNILYKKHPSGFSYQNTLYLGKGLPSVSLSAKKHKSKKITLKA